MIEKLYYWMRNKMVVPEDRDRLSAGIWHDRLRQNALAACRSYNGKFLEVGCGEGLFLVKLAALKTDCEVVGVDNDRKQLSILENERMNRGLHNLRALYADGRRLPFKDAYFNVVLCINVFVNLESIEVIKEMLTEIKRVCQKKGIIIFDFRNSLNPFLRLKYKLAPYYDLTIKEKKLPLNTYHPKQIKEILRELDFKVIHQKYIGFPGNALSPVIMIEAEKC